MEDRKLWLEIRIGQKSVLRIIFKITLDISETNFPMSSITQVFHQPAFLYETVLNIICQRQTSQDVLHSFLAYLLIEDIT
jgi:hypothetical protein